MLVADTPTIAPRPTLTPPMIDTDTDLETPRVDTVSGDHDLFAHIVRGTKKKKAQDIVLEARISGIPIVALCGKKWIPQRDPQKFPICPECLEIAAKLRRK